MTTQEITMLFAWMTTINAGILLFSTIAIISMRRFIARVHGKMFNIDEKDALRAYFQYLGQYKIAVIVFNLAPYLALRVVF